MRTKALSMAIVLGLLISVVSGVQTTLANGINWPSEPLITDPTGDTQGDFGYNIPSIDISNVYVTHDSQNLYINVEGLTIRYFRGSSPGGWTTVESTATIYLNNLVVTVSDSDPTGNWSLTSSYGSVQEPCVLTLPLDDLGGATQINIGVRADYSSKYPYQPYRSQFDRAPDDGFETYVMTNELTVEIDIKPGSFPNSINPNSKGVIPVAILTTADFDASTVDGDTARFGPGEASPVHYAIEDVDNDGDDDMILHFKTQDTGIAAGDTEATLTAETIGGTDIVGTDSVRTVPP